MTYEEFKELVQQMLNVRKEYRRAPSKSSELEVIKLEKRVQKALKDQGQKELF